MKSCKCGKCYRRKCCDTTTVCNLKIQCNAKIHKNLDVCRDATIKGGLEVCGEIKPGKERVQEYNFSGTISNPYLPEGFFGFAPALTDTLPPNTILHEFDVDVIGRIETILSWTPWDIQSNDPDLDFFLYEPGADTAMDVVQINAIFNGAVDNLEGGTTANPEKIDFPVTKLGKWKILVRYFGGSVEADYQLDIKITEEVKGLKIKSYLDLSNAAVIPDQHPCIGWWTQVTKLWSGANNLLEINRAPNGQLYCKTYYGSQAGQFFEPTWLDTIGTNSPYQIFEVTEVSPTQILLHNFVAKPPYFLWSYDSAGYGFEVDSNNYNVAHGYIETTIAEGSLQGEFPGNGFPIFQKWVKLNDRPEIKQFDSYNDCTDPRKIFEWCFEQTQLQTGTQMNKEIQATGLNPDWPGFAQVNQIKSQLLNEAREYQSSIDGENGSTVWPTLKKTVDIDDLLDDAFTVLKPYTITSPSIPIPGIIETLSSGGFPYIAVWDPNTVSSLLGMVVEISGATGFAEQRISEERINTNFQVFFAIPGLVWFGINYDRLITWGHYVLSGGNNINITPISALVSLPSHGLSSYDLIEIEGAQGFNGLTNEQINGTFAVLDWWGDGDHFDIIFDPSVNITADGSGGGANASVEQWVIPYQPWDTPPFMFNVFSTRLNTTKYTTLITNGFNGYHIGAKIVVEGFEGEYNIINGEHRSAPNYNTAGSRYRPLDQVYLDTFYNPDTDKEYNFIPIPLDTSSLPLYDPEVHGTATITISYGPVTATTGYYDLVGACNELLGQSVIGTHSLITMGSNALNNENLLTWEEANEYAAFGTGWINDGTATRTLNIQDSISNNAAPTYLIQIPNNLPPKAITGPVIDQDKRFDKSDPKYLYTISRENYLEADSVHNFFMRVNPNSVPESDPLHRSHYLTLFGYNHNGMIAPPGEYTLEFKTVPFYSTGNPVNHYDAYESFTGVTDSFVPGYKLVATTKDNLYFGLVKDELTDGVRTGYVRVGETLLMDNPLNLMATTGWQEKDEIATFHNTRRMFALMMKYFTDNNVEKIILDIRANSGGLTLNCLAISSFFGGNRPGFDTVYTPIGNGNSQMLILSDLLDSGIKPIQTNYDIYETIVKEVPTDDTASTVFPDFEGGTFPGSDVMFRGEDKKCVILTSTNAYSGGDVFPHYFRGTYDYPNDLGADNTDPNRCQSIFVGGADSRLGGAFSGYGHNPVNLTSDLKTTPSLTNNEPYQAIDISGESAFLQIDNERGEYYANQLEKMAWVPGKDVGPLNCSLANAWWQDIGLADLGTFFDTAARDAAPWNTLPNGGIPDNGSPGDSGTTSDTWRDYALEESLMS